MPSGPCTLCGAVNYPMSCGGPYICPSCDCGIPPEVEKLKRQLREAKAEIFRMKVYGQEPLNPAERSKELDKILEILGLQGG